MRPFAEAILDPERPAPAGLVGPDGQQTSKRFDVYRNNVTVSLREALAVGFPAIAKLLGEESFKNLATGFLRQNPPSSPLLMHYGAGIPEFLESIDALAKFPYLGDVARLELALRESYHAADETPLDSARLGKIAPETLNKTSITFASSVRLIQSDWPIVSIWAFNMRDGTKPQMRAETALILRSQFDPEPHSLNPAATASVKALMSGASLGDALEAGAAIHAAYDIGPLLGLLLSQNALIDLEVRT